MVNGKITICHSVHRMSRDLDVIGMTHQRAGEGLESLELMGRTQVREGGKCPGCRLHQTPGLKLRLMTSLK